MVVVVVVASRCGDVTNLGFTLLLLLLIPILLSPTFIPISTACEYLGLYCGGGNGVPPTLPIPFLSEVDCSSKYEAVILGFDDDDDDDDEGDDRYIGIGMFFRGEVQSKKTSLLLVLLFVVVVVVVVVAVAVAFFVVERG